MKAPEGLVPHLPSVVVYEANLRALGPKVGFEALRARLGRIKALGVNVLWLMPVHPVGRIRSAGGLGSPYAVADFDGVNPEFGTAADLRTLVASAHRLRMAVVLDWVGDHTSWDNPWLRSHPDWYLHDARGRITIPPGTAWNDVAALDYGNPAMCGAMIDSMRGWIRRFDVDGFRCDAADRMPSSFWTRAISSLRASTTKRLFMLAEGFRADDYASGFDLTYGWDFCNRLREVFNGKPATEIAAAASNEAKGVLEGARRLRFITNHDLSAWDGSTLEFYKTRQGVRAAFTVAALYGGNPLIYTGQEVDWDKRIPIFDDSTIDWRNDGAGRWMSRLMELRSRHPALLTGSVADLSTNDLIVFTRSEGSDRALVLANVRDRTVVAGVPRSLQGEWRDGEGGGSMVVSSRVTLPPYGCQVLVRTVSHPGLAAARGQVPGSASVRPRCIWSSSYACRQVRPEVPLSRFPSVTDLSRGGARSGRRSVRSDCSQTRGHKYVPSRRPQLRI